MMIVDAPDLILDWAEGPTSRPDGLFCALHMNSSFQTPYLPGSATESPRMASVSMWTCNT